MSMSLFCGPSNTKTNKRPVHLNINAHGKKRKIVPTTNKRNVIQNDRSLSSHVKIASTNRQHLQTSVSSFFEFEQSKGGLVRLTSENCGQYCSLLSLPVLPPTIPWTLPSTSNNSTGINDSVFVCILFSSFSISSISFSTASFFSINSLSC